MPLFALPLQVKVTADGLGVWVLGGDGQILLGLMHPGPDGLARLRQIVEMANRADKALEAAGYEQLVNIVRDAKLLLRQFCETCGEKPDCSECGWQVLGERMKAALQRAGEG